jgi:hypothetical protein
VSGRAVIVALMIVAAFVIVLARLTRPAHAHDTWINQGSYRNPAGEWCCGAEDCGLVGKDAVHATAGGYSVRGVVTYGEAVTGNAADGPTRTENLNEVVAYSQAQPSPDGAYWRCKRPDGTPRCFFAPPPGS